VKKIDLANPGGARGDAAINLNIGREGGEAEAQLDNLGLVSPLFSSSLDVCQMREKRVIYLMFSYRVVVLGDGRPALARPT